MVTDAILPAFSLGWREIVRFHRDRARVVSGIATALLFWVLIGFGMAGSFAPAGMPAGVGAVEYLFPGTVVFVVLVTAIVGTFSLIEDRRSGFLQGVIVAPVPRSSERSWAGRRSRFSRAPCSCRCSGRSGSRSTFRESCSGPAPSLSWRSH
jgi:hypothetical protein